MCHYYMCCYMWSIHVSLLHVVTCDHTCVTTACVVTCDHTCVTIACCYMWSHMCHYYMCCYMWSIHVSLLHVVACDHTCVTTACVVTWSHMCHYCMLHVIHTCVTIACVTCCYRHCHVSEWLLQVIVSFLCPSSHLSVPTSVLILLATPSMPLPHNLATQPGHTFYAIAT